MRSIISHLDIFRERMDFSIEQTVPQLVKFSVRLQQLIRSHGALLAQPQDRRLAEQLVRQVAVGEEPGSAAGAGGDPFIVIDTSGAQANKPPTRAQLIKQSDDDEDEQAEIVQHFSSEQQAEQEQEQEQEQGLCA